MPMKNKTKLKYDPTVEMIRVLNEVISNEHIHQPVKDLARRRLQQLLTEEVEKADNV